MITNKKMAALLWGILPKQVRFHIETSLTIKERQILQEELKLYQKLSKQEQIQLQKKLHRFFCVSYKKFYGILLFLSALFVFLFITYVLLYPKSSPFFLFSLFWPLFLGILSFYLLITLPKHDFGVLFRIPKKLNSYILSIVIFYLLLFNMFLINQTYVSFTKLNFLEKIILSLGISLAPLSEEIAFRYHIPKMICTHDTVFCMYLSQFLSNLGFAILHLPKDFFEFILYFFSGMFLAILRIEAKSLFLPFFVHSLSNLWIFLFFNT